MSNKNKLIFLDTNILLDSALRRVPFFQYSDAIFTEREKREYDIAVAWHTLSNVYYVIRSNKSHAEGIEFLTDLLE
jgi:predicted nucleic acid-binding protein